MPGSVNIITGIVYLLLLPVVVCFNVEGVVWNKWSRCVVRSLMDGDPVVMVTRESWSLSIVRFGRVVDWTLVGVCVVCLL